MYDNKKKMAALIIAKAKGGSMPVPEAEGPMESKQEENMGPETAAQELIDAVNAKDASGVVEAFKALMEMCDMGSDSQEQE